MKLFFSWLAFICGTYVIQSSLLPLIAYNGISPDLLLLLVVSFGFLQGRRFGVFMGFLVGLLQDLATGSFFGVNVFSKMFLGYASGVFSNRVFKEQAFLPLFASILASIINYFIILLLMVLLGYRFNLAAHLQSVLLPMLWYNVLLSVPMHRLVSAMCEWLTEKK